MGGVVGNRLHLVSVNLFGIKGGGRGVCSVTGNTTAATATCLRCFRAAPLRRRARRPPAAAG